jgi:hypothetical protein
MVATTETRGFHHENTVAALYCVAAFCSIMNIRENVEAGFRAIEKRIQSSSVPLSADIESAIRAASEVWLAGNCDLATSLLVDALIRMYDDRRNRQQLPSK